MQTDAQAIEGFSSHFNDLESRDKPIYSDLTVFEFTTNSPSLR